MDRGRAPQKIDREKTCPFLLRVFYKAKEERPLDEYQKLLPSVDQQEDELQIYTWLDITLRDLSALIKDGLPNDYKENYARMEINFIFQNARGEMKKRNAGTIHFGKRRPEDKTTLKQLEYVIGDFIDVSLWGDRKSDQLSWR